MKNLKGFLGFITRDSGRQTAAVWTVYSRWLLPVVLAVCLAGVIVNSVRTSYLIRETREATTFHVPAVWNLTDENEETGGGH